TYYAAVRDHHCLLAILTAGPSAPPGGLGLPVCAGVQPARWPRPGSSQQPLLLVLELAQSLADGCLPGLELLGQPCPPRACWRVRPTWAGSASNAHRSAQASSYGWSAEI